MRQEFVEDRLMITTRETMEILLRQKDYAELKALYDFYYYTAKWQKTDRIKATISYTARGIHWGEAKVRKYKKRLVELGLIEDAKNIDQSSGKVKGWYVKVNYVFKNHPVENDKGGDHPDGLPQCGSNHSVDETNPNALPPNSLNALELSKVAPQNGADPSPPSGKKKKTERERMDDKTPMPLEEYVATMRGSPHRHIQILAEYAETKKPDLKTKGQWYGFTKRNIRAARNLSPNDDETLGRAHKLIERDLKSHKNPKGFLTKWTLETLEKYVDEVTTNV